MIKQQFFFRSRISLQGRRSAEILNRRVLLTFTLFIVLFALSYGKDLCPPPNCIKPCKCTYGKKPVTYTCSNILDQDTIEGVIERSLDWLLNSLLFYHSSLLYVNKTLIESKDVTILQIHNSRFTTLFNSAPEEGNKIRIISLKSSIFTRGLDWKLFKNLSLRALEITRVQLRRIKNSFIQNIKPTLDNIEMIKADIHSLHNETFAKLPLLWRLSLAFNSLKDIKRSMFPHKSVLSYFDFSHNKIRILPDVIFSNMPRLRWVFLNNNHIKTFSSAVWKGVFHRLEEAQLDHNQILCDCKVKWYTKMSRSVKVTVNCDTPEDFKGKDLSKLTEEDFYYCDRERDPFRIINESK